jgi:hypothetical protein
MGDAAAAAVNELAGESASCYTRTSIAPPVVTILPALPGSAIPLNWGGLEENRP